MAHAQNPHNVAVKYVGSAQRREGGENRSLRDNRAAFLPSVYVSYAQAQQGWWSAN